MSSSIVYVVITPVRNERENLPRTIASFVGQTIRPYRWVIVDDGSTDGTSEIVDEAAAQLKALGVVMMGQTDHFCPADKKLYSLRDVTGTVPSIPLITASIMSKRVST